MGEKVYYLETPFCVVHVGFFFFFFFFFFGLTGLFLLGTLSRGCYRVGPLFSQ